MARLGRLSCLPLVFLQEFRNYGGNNPTCLQQLCSPVGRGKFLRLPPEISVSPVQHECRIMYGAKTQTHVSYIYLKASEFIFPGS